MESILQSFYLSTVVMWKNFVNIRGRKENWKEKNEKFIFHSNTVMIDNNRQTQIIMLVKWFSAIR